MSVRCLLDRVNGVLLSVRLSLRQQVVVVGFGSLQPATWSYHTTDWQPTALVLSVLLVQSAGTFYLAIQSHRTFLFIVSNNGRKYFLFGKYRQLVLLKRITDIVDALQKCLFDLFSFDCD